MSSRQAVAYEANVEQPAAGEAETIGAIAYMDGGPPDGPAVLLLHGWPDDATTWDGVAPALHAAGLRTIAPMLRGFGGTRFQSPDAARTGNRCRVWAFSDA